MILRRCSRRSGKPKEVVDLVDNGVMEEQLVAIAPEDPSLALEVNDRSYVKGLRLDEMAGELACHFSHFLVLHFVMMHNV